MFTFGPNGSSAVALPDQLKNKLCYRLIKKKKKKALRAIFVMKSKNNQENNLFLGYNDILPLDSFSIIFDV